MTVVLELAGDRTVTAEDLGLAAQGSAASAHQFQSF
jgi:hypothetical protein